MKNQMKRVLGLSAALMAFAGEAGAANIAVGIGVPAYPAPPVYAAPPPPPYMAEPYAYPYPYGYVYPYPSYYHRHHYYDWGYWRRGRR